MPPYETQAPEEIPEPQSPSSSIFDDSIYSDSPTPSEIFDVNSNSTSDSENGDSYTLSAPGYEKIRIPLEQNLKQLLVKVTETDNLEAVETLRLRVIARDFSLQRLPMYIPHLKELNLDGSALMSLRDLGCDLHSLKVLRVGRCGLNSLDGLFGLQTITELHAGFNHINDLSPCAVLPDIEMLDLRKNHIEGINSVSFLFLCPTLRHLTLEECPTAQIENYRNTIKNLLPELLSLDGIIFTDEIKKKEDKIISRFPPISKPDSSKLPNEKCNKTSTEFSEIKRRPNTTEGIATRRCNRKLPIRPSTARTANTNDFLHIFNGDDFNLKDIRTLLTPSTLTSGNLICGNPALGLKGRKLFEAWNDDLDLENT